jgi:hypothetical protein
MSGTSESLMFCAGRKYGLRQVKEIRKEISKYFQMNENENTTYQNLWMPVI